MKKLLLFILLGALNVCAADTTVTVTLTWDNNPPTDKVTEYRVYQLNSAMQPVALIATVNTNLAVLTNIGLASVTSWAVTARNAEGLESAPSNPVTYTAPKTPGAPVQLRILSAEVRTPTMLRVQLEAAQAVPVIREAPSDATDVNALPQ